MRTTVAACTAAPHLWPRLCAVKKEDTLNEMEITLLNDFWCAPSHFLPHRPAPQRAATRHAATQGAHGHRALQVPL